MIIIEINIFIYIKINKKASYFHEFKNMNIIYNKKNEQTTHS